MSGLCTWSYWDRGQAGRWNNEGLKGNRKTQTEKRERAKREGWGFRKKEGRRRGALSRCYGPDLI